jgi:hypothetical protein
MSDLRVGGSTVRSTTAIGRGMLNAQGQRQVLAYKAGTDLTRKRCLR